MSLASLWQLKQQKKFIYVPQKKILLQTTTTDGVSVIELPLEHHTNSDSGAGSPITVQVSEVNEDGEDVIGQQQQVTAQVALVQSESTNGAGQHYFTVTGEWEF